MVVVYYVIMYALTHSDTESAVFVHELGREKDPKLLPPLAKLYLDGEECNGLGDLFYVTAVTIKKLKDSKVSNNVEFEAHTTLVTLLSDSGLYDAAEKHLAKAKELQPDRAELKIRGGIILLLCVLVWRYLLRCCYSVCSTDDPWRVLVIATHQRHAHTATGAPGSTGGR